MADQDIVAGVLSVVAELIGTGKLTETKLARQLERKLGIVVDEYLIHDYVQALSDADDVFSSWKERNSEHTEN